MNASMAALQPWQWPTEEWRRRIGQVRAGRSLRPRRWKGGARCAIALCFDSDHETNELRDGGNSIGRLGWGEYGSRVGVPRIVDLLRQHAIPATLGGIFQLTMHPHIIGYRSRLWIVEELVRHARSLGDVWFATHREIAQWALCHREQAS